MRLRHRFAAGAVGLALVLGGVALSGATGDGPDATSPVNPAPLAGANAAAPRATAGAPSDAPQEAGPPYDGLYHFIRVSYGSGGGGFGGFGRRRGRRGAMWSHDYPTAESNFLAIIQETTLIRTTRRSYNIISFDDPELFKHPIAYIVEPGYWDPTDAEAKALGDYLHKGGFLIVDDFRGQREFDNLVFQLRRAIPEAEIVQIPDTNPIFDSFFRVDLNEVPPPYGGLPPLWLGVHEDNDPEKRVMVMINANNDMAEYWEFSDRGYYPIDLSNESYKLGVDYVLYGMTH